MRVTNAELARMYAEFNKKYFGNKLPKDMAVRFEYLHGKWGRTRIYANSRPLFIEISRELCGSMCFAAMTLLHEMVHVKFPHLDHGPKFHKEMKRLARIGAFNNWW